MERSIALRSAVVYTGISLFVALAFLAASTLAGGYNAVARFGGAAWVFLLTMIVTMPVVTARTKAKSR